MTQTATTTRTAIPERMRASVLTGLKTLNIEQVPTPPMASDEVLVEVAAVGVCGSDTHYYRHGRIGDFVVTGPLILGHELSGRIVAVGEEVPESRIGERVALEPQKNCRKCRECRAGRYNLCRNMEFYATPPIDGAFAQYCVIRTEFAHTVPDSMSDESAALLEPLSVAVTTMRKAGIVPASSILIAGAGPIGIICAQATRAFGASEIIVTDLVPERRERALRYGATHVIDPRETDVANAGPGCQRLRRRQRITAGGDVRHQGRTSRRPRRTRGPRLVRDDSAH
jgi:L-iditol 2-dehydrogenase